VPVALGRADPTVFDPRSALRAPSLLLGEGGNRSDRSSRSFPPRVGGIGPSQRKYVVEAVGSAVTDRASLLGVKWSGCAALTVTADPDSMGPHCTRENTC
jgi:hypothetical protein